MAKQSINIGTIPNDGTGTTLRDGGDLINDNFNEIYGAIGNGTSITLTSTPTELNLLSGVSALVTASTSDVFTNKSISGSTNTLSNIGNSSLTNSSITITGDDSSAQSISLGGGILFTGGSGITTSVSGNEITFATDGSIVTETSTDTLTNKTISGSSNTLSNIGNSSLTNSAITLVDESSSTTTISLGESLKVTGGTGIDTTISGDGVSIAVDSTVVTESSTDTLTNKTINGPDNTLTNIANSSLANSSVTIGDDAIALGGTQTSIANLSLTGASGTINLTSSGNKIRFNFANTGALPSATDYQGMFASEAATAKAFYAEGGAWNEIVTENSSIGRLSNVDITSSPPTNGQVLVFNSSNGRFEPGNNGSGGFSAGTDLDQAGADIQDIGYIGHRSPDATITQTLTVTVATKTTEHTAYGDGSSSGYVIDGHEGPHLQLSRGVYKFDTSDGTNSGHPFRFYEDEGKNIAFTSDVTTSGSGGSAGDHATLTIDDDTPTPLFYQCSSHGNMGGRIDIIGGKRRRLNITTDKSNTGDGSATTITILANRTVDDILVFVNGICLVPTDDYTISGTTLTFATAPANTAEIVVRYLG
tara:strand:- start:719 stop:2491 length:1773 start_codon:yes stop_codon:yes gene_type:complete